MVLLAGAGRALRCESACGTRSHSAGERRTRARRSEPAARMVRGPDRAPRVALLGWRAVDWQRIELRHTVARVRFVRDSKLGHGYVLQSVSGAILDDREYLAAVAVEQAHRADAVS